MALIAGITGQELQALAIATLRGAGTLAGDRVFEQRDWPTGVGMLPAILVKVTRERCISLSRNGPYAFNTVLTLVVIARQVGFTPEPVGVDLLVMQEQIKAAFLGTHSFNQCVQQVLSIESENVVTADGRQHIGEVGMSFELEVFQEYGPNDGTDLINITGTITNPDTGATRSIFDVAFPPT